LERGDAGWRPACRRARATARSRPAPPRPILTGNHDGERSAPGAALVKFMDLGDDGGVSEPDNEAMNTQPTLLLVHGSWPTGSSWARVQAHLAPAGVRSLAPTLAGHEPGVDRAGVTHDDYVTSVLDAVASEPDPVILVGHSFGGSVISRVARLRPE